MNFFVALDRCGIDVGMRSGNDRVVMARDPGRAGGMLSSGAAWVSWGGSIDSGLLNLRLGLRVLRCQFVFPPFVPECGQNNGSIEL